MELLLDPQAWIAFLTLAALEIVLGVDNIIFISILVGRLPEHQRQRARTLGLAFAMLTRIGLLLSLAWVMTLTAPLFSIPVMGKEISGRDLILIGGGLFLLWKSVHEIHGSLEGEDEETHAAGAVRATFAAVIVQIAIIDIVFSLDSVITAVGLVDSIPVMVLAIVLAMLVMVLASNPVGEFIDEHPTVKMLALAFLLLVGVALIADGFDLHIPRAYLYFAMAFSGGVEGLNILSKRRERARVQRLRERERELEREEKQDKDDEGGFGREL